MPVAQNPETGEILVLGQGGEWAAPKVAKNPQTGESLYLDGSEWKPLPATPKKPRSQAEASFRGLGLGARDVIDGLTAVPGLIYDLGRAALNTPTAIYNTATGQKAPYPFPASAKNLIDKAQNVVGLPSPETAGERVQSDIQRNVAALIPTMGAGVMAQGIQGLPRGLRSLAQMLAANPVAQVTGAAGAGGGGGVAREKGAGPVGQTLAALAGGVGGAAVGSAAEVGGRALAAAAEPFSRAGQERIAANSLLRQSSDPGSLAARIDDGMADPMRRLPGSRVTTGVASRDPGLMVMEQGLRSDVGRLPGQGGMSGSAAFREVEANRNGTRLAALLAMSDGLTPEQRGQMLRRLLEGQRAEARDDVSRLYRAIDPDNTTAVSLYRVGRGMFDAAERRYGPGGGPMPAEAQAVLDEVNAAADAGRSVNFRWLQNVRSRLGGEAGKSAAQRDQRAAQTFGDMRAALDDAVNTAATERRGFTPNQSTAWQTATEARRDMGARFGRDGAGANVVGQVLGQTPSALR